MCISQTKRLHTVKGDCKLFMNFNEFDIHHRTNGCFSPKLPSMKCGTLCLKLVLTHYYVVTCSENKHTESSYFNILWKHRLSSLKRYNTDAIEWGSLGGRWGRWDKAWWRVLRRWDGQSEGHWLKPGVLKLWVVWSHILWNLILFVPPSPNSDLVWYVYFTKSSTNNQQYIFNYISREISAYL